MYDLNKRSYFTTLGELRALLAKLPDDTKVCTSGVYGSYVHFAKDDSLVSFDDEDLGEDYAEDCPIEDPDFWEGQEALMMKEHEARLTAHAHSCGNEDYTTQDQKILFWNKQNYESFINSFTKDELSEMLDYLYRHPNHPIECDYNFDSYDDRCGLIYEYTIHWIYDLLCDNAYANMNNARTLLEVSIAL